jgi:hypothetical protein
MCHKALTGTERAFILLNCKYKHPVEKSFCTYSQKLVLLCKENIEI